MPATDLSQSPTLTHAATQAGVILGTAAYMSPEQARGEPTDQRADVWAFGVVLSEMLTGRRTFEGRTVSDVLAAVLAKEPQWNSLPDNLHPRLRQLLERCLAKEPRDRYAGVGDPRVDIQSVLADPSGVLVQPTGDVAQAASQSKLPWVAALILAVITGVAVWNLKPTPQPVAARFYHELPDGQGFTRTGRPLVAVSTDGNQIVYVANSQLYLRNLNEVVAHPIQGTDEDPTSPFFSPGGEWIGYWSASNRQLKKIAPIGGAAVTLCAATNPFGASWGSDGTILYGQLDGIMRVSANGGTPELVIPTETPEQVHGPQMLPGGEWVLFTLTSATGPTRWDEAQIVVQSLESGERKILWEGGSDASCVPTGHLVYAIEDVLFALPFDLARLEVSGGPVPMVEGVRRALSPATNTATASYGFSDLGTLIYLPGSVGSRRILALADRNGAVEPLDVPPAEYLNARLSPDGSKLAVEILSDAGVAIWVYDLSGETAPQRLTLEGNNISPVWTPDGERITFASDRDGGGLYWKSANGSAAAELLVTAEEAEIPWSWTPDGEILALRNRNHIGMLSLGNSTTEVLVAGADAAQFSPDGQWVAYEGGTQGSGSEIFVQPFPLTGGIHQISRGGGRRPNLVSGWTGVVL